MSRARSSAPKQQPHKILERETVDEMIYNTKKQGADIIPFPLTPFKGSMFGMLEMEHGRRAIDWAQDLVYVAITI